MGLLDTLSVQPKIACDFKKLRSAYAGACLRVRRSSDNTEQDIGFDGNGDLDWAAADTFRAGGTLYVTKWYNQITGATFDFINAVNANQPVLDTSLKEIRGARTSSHRLYTSANLDLSASDKLTFIARTRSPLSSWGGLDNLHLFSANSGANTNGFYVSFLANAYDGAYNYYANDNDGSTYVDRHTHPSDSLAESQNMRVYTIRDDRSLNPNPGQTFKEYKNKTDVSASGGAIFAAGDTSGNFPSVVANIGYLNGAYGDFAISALFIWSGDVGSATTNTTDTGKVVESLIVTATPTVSLPTTSINLGSSFSPTASITNDDGTTKTFVWKVGATTVTGATTANPTIANSYFSAGNNTITCEVTQSGITKSDSKTVFVANITGASSTQAATEDYDHNVSNVTNGSVSILSGSGSVAVVDSDTVRFTKPTTGSGTTVIKIADSTDANKYGTKSIDWAEDLTPPTTATGVSASAVARHTNRITWTHGTDAESTISGAKIRRDTVNTFDSPNLVEFIHNSAVAQYDDNTADDGIQYFYEVKSKSAGGYSNSWSSSASVTTWNAPPTITNAAQLTNAQLGRSYRETIVTAGGNGARTLSVQPGHSLPAWLSLDTPTNPNDLIGTHNALATNELVYLRVTDANGQYTDYTFQLTTVDTESPTDIDTLTATKASNSQVDITSSGSTDNSGSVTYENQRSSDNFVSDIVALASTAKDFSDVYQLPGTAEKNWKWRQRPKDASNNAGNWVYSGIINIVPPLQAAFDIAANFDVAQNVTATRTSTGGSAAAHTYKWRWYGTATILSTSANPNLGQLTVGSYDLELEETDAYGTVSTVHHAFTVSGDTTPEITSPATLPWAQTGVPYSYQLTSIKGDGVKSWEISTPVAGVEITTGGLLSVADPQGAQIVVTVKVTDEDGDFDTLELTINVSDLAVWDWDINYPMEFEYDKKVRVFIPRSGAKFRQTRIDRGMKWKLDVKSKYFSPDLRDAIIDFHEEHFPDKNFLFHDKETDEYIEAWISSTAKITRSTSGKGEFAFTIEQV